MAKVVQFIHTMDDNLIFWNVDFRKAESVQKLHDSVFAHRITTDLPNKFVEFSRFIPAFASLKGCEIPIFVDHQIEVLANECNITEKSELHAVLEYLLYLGEILWAKETNNLVIVNPNQTLSTIFSFFKDEDSMTNKSLSRSGIEQTWTEKNLEAFYFPFLWGFLFHASVVFPLSANEKLIINSVKNVIIPCKGKKSIDDDKYHEKSCYFLCREFEFDFVLPGFTQHLIHTFISICDPSVTIAERQIWKNGVDITMKTTRQYLVHLTIREIPSPSTFSTVFRYVLSTNEKSLEHFCQKLFSLGCFQIDNFVRDFYLVLYDHHMHTWIIGKKPGRFTTYVRVGSREHVVKTYFATRVQQIQGFNVIDLIPEIVDPSNAITDNKYILFSQLYIKANSHLCTGRE